MRDEFAGNLSGGQRKLLEMARALMADPTLIMLDEPMAGVNPALKQSLLGHIKELKNEGRTVLFVEHDMDMVHEISDWVLVMAQGTLIAEGTAIDDLREPGGHRRLPRRPPRRRPRRDRRGRRRSRSSASTPSQLGLDQLQHLGEIDHEAELGGRRMSDADEPGPPTSSRPHDVVAGYVPEVNILNGCDLTVAPGEFVGIIGPNGAGKSTFLKAVLGLVAVRSGTILLHGDEITGQPAHKLVKRGVGFVPQTKNVFQTLTVRENLEMGCFLAPKRFAERYEVVTGLFPRLGERADQRAGSLSGGERQMVAMGRALMLDPSLLLLDEPSAGLSPMLQDEVFLRCKLINDTGVAILMVEQNARRCLQVCHRGYVLDQGRNAYTGTGRELLTDPKVIELYLGTLARACTTPTRSPAPKGPGSDVDPGSACGAPDRSVAGVEVDAERVADVAVAAVDGLVARADALLDHRPQDLRRLVEADDQDGVRVGSGDLVDLAVERRRPSGRRSCARRPRRPTPRWSWSPASASPLPYESLRLMMATVWLPSATTN